MQFNQSWLEFYLVLGLLTLQRISQDHCAVGPSHPREPPSWTRNRWKTEDPRFDYCYKFQWFFSWNQRSMCPIGLNIIKNCKRITFKHKNAYFGSLWKTLADERRNTHDCWRTNVVMSTGPSKTWGAMWLSTTIFGLSGALFVPICIKNVYIFL